MVGCTAEDAQDIDGEGHCANVGAGVAGVGLNAAVCDDPAVLLGPGDATLFDLDLSLSQSWELFRMDVAPEKAVELAAYICGHLEAAMANSPVSLKLGIRSSGLDSLYDRVCSPILGDN